MTEHQDSTTNSQTPPTGAESNADGQTRAPEGDGTAEQDTGSQKPNREAARYRVERNEARESLAAAESRIEAMNRREISRLAGEHLAVGEDLFHNGNGVAEYLDPDTGEVDAERVAEDAKRLLSERPRMGKTPRGFDPSQGTGGVPSKQAPDWGALFK